MKFEKFVKQLGGSGVIQTRENGEKWLASTTSMLKIPDQMGGIIAENIVQMPTNIEAILRREPTGTPAFLSKAILPCGDSSIKDCIRVFAANENPNKLKLPISNDDYGLIDFRHDQVEMLTNYDLETEEMSVVALLVKRPYINDDAELIGVIFPMADYVDNI